AVRERYALTLHDGYRAHAHAAALAYRSMKDTKLYYDATTIRAPTLIVWGAEDRIFHPRNALAWSRRIPGSLMAVIPRAGHAPFLERPEAFNRVIGEFLDVGRLPDLGDEYTIRDPALEEGAWSWLY
ncbi:MAG: alpha/beta hydrolase, partial [Candidatus Methylomirabilis sp.]|nr:alpha/beta hydrolase [Deltaproteobacteria bacterium]